MTARIIVAAAVAATCLVGCGDSATDDGAPAAAPTSADATPADAATSTPSDDATVAAASDDDEVLGEQTFGLRENPEDEVTVGVRSLRVEGRVMTLRLTVTPRFASASDSDDISLYDVWERSVFAPTLIDMDNLKEYRVIRDGPATWSSDSVDNRTVNGHPMEVYAVFAAPEDDIDSFDLRVADWWQPFDDIPVER
jgi:hypothetical protein